MSDEESCSAPWKDSAGPFFASLPSDLLSEFYKHLPKTDCAMLLLCNKAFAAAAKGLFKQMRFVLQVQLKINFRQSIGRM